MSSGFSRACSSLTYPNKVQDLDHCGIIAGIIDELGLVAEIDELIGRHGNPQVTTGQAVKAMIINGLGMISSPLYLFSKFFEGKATEHLLGEGILPEHLNDDCNGLTLDKLYAAGVTKVFITLALKAANKMGVETICLHLDSSSFHVDGKYLADEAAEVEPGKITITLRLFERSSTRSQTIHRTIKEAQKAKPPNHHEMGSSL